MQIGGCAMTIGSCARAKSLPQCLLEMAGGHEGRRRGRAVDLSTEYPRRSRRGGHGEELDRRIQIDDDFAPRAGPCAGPVLSGER